MGLIRQAINSMKKDYPWEKFYKKDQRHITVPNMSIYSYLIENTIRETDLIAINYFGNKISYKKFHKSIDLCAKALKANGINKGDVVTVCMANTPEAVVCFYAINKIGAIANMVHPLSAEEEIKHSLVSTNSVMCFVIDVSYDKVKNIVEDTKVKKTIVVSASNSMPRLLSVGYKLFKSKKIELSKDNEKYDNWSNFISKGNFYDGETFVKLTSEDDAVILHSGGTTGTPKNIVLTNGNINSVVEQLKKVLPDINSDDSLLAILPLFHCFGLVVCVHTPLCYGATTVLIPQFDAKRFDKIINKYKPTIIAGVPTLFEALVSNKYMENVDLSYVKYVVSGGDTLNSEKNKKVNDFLESHNCKVHITQGYGMTESSGPVCFGVCGSDKLGSIGIPFPSNVIKIVEPSTGITLGTGEIGEICISGPSVMKEYLNNPEETNEIIKIEDGKRYIHTGDLGYMDKDGVVFYVQRLKRMIIVSGYNVYPSHIEDILMKHPFVESCGVVGIPHPYKVQVPKAYIVLKEGIEDSIENRLEIKKYCKKNLSTYMIPKEFEFRNSLPKTMIGKVDYKNLK